MTNRAIMSGSVLALLAGLFIWKLGSTDASIESSRDSAIDVYQKEQGYRPEVEIWGRKAMVSSSVPLASLAGARMLMKGGNAVDAAVAMGAALNVTWPNNCQLGGDTVMMVYWAETGEFVTLDAYSKVPANPNLRDMLEELPGVKGNPEAYREEPRDLVEETGLRPRGDGVLTAMIPGTAGAWTRAMEKFGSLPLSEVLAPAIEYAEEGFPVNSGLARSLKSSEASLRKYPSTEEIFFPGGKAMEPGEVLVQKDLASTRKKIAAGGFDTFYKGEIAKAIVDYVQDHGGVITREDMAGYDVVQKRSPTRLRSS